MYIKTFTKPFDSAAHTLSPDYLGFCKKSGWTISGEVHEDYYEWVNDFEATHPVYGTIKGDFEEEVQAESREAYDNFVKNFPPEEWDYYDI